jgi:hypothetical protein
MLFDIFRPQFRKSTTCDISSEEISSHEKKNSSTMNKIRQNKSRRFSLVKFELPTANSNVGTKGLKILFSRDFNQNNFLFLKMKEKCQFHLQVIIFFKNYFLDNLVPKLDLVHWEHL